MAEGEECDSLRRNSPAQCRLLAANPAMAGTIRARSGAEWTPPAPRPAAPGGTPTVAILRTADAPPCAYLGLPIPGEGGAQATRECAACRGSVRLKLWACLHPGHEEHPETTAKDCRRCADYEAGGAERATPNRSDDVSAGTMPVKMVVPSQKRPGIWRGGVIQIMATRSCDLACHGCTAGSNLVSKPAVMTPEQFEAAVLSLEGYWGVYGCFGGNPCTSRYFPDYCRILKAHVPYQQRGIWTNRMMGHGALIRTTFNPAVSNVNVHLSQEAYDEFAADWPEAIEARKEHVDRGLTDDARHGSPWISMKDLEELPFPDGSSRPNTEANRWELIGNCTINKNWSSIVGLVGGELRAFACEIMLHAAAMHAENPDWDETGQPMPDVGLAVEKDWWRRPLADFEGQFRTFCHNCSVPLNRPGQLAIGGEREEFSERHRWIARPKVRGREVAFISSETLEKRDRPATQYLKGVTPGYRDQ
jgi:hypothetical protein